MIFYWQVDHGDKVGTIAGVVCPNTLRGRLGRSFVVPVMVVNLGLQLFQETVFLRIRFVRTSRGKGSFGDRFFLSVVYGNIFRSLICLFTNNAGINGELVVIGTMGYLGGSNQLRFLFRLASASLWLDGSHFFGLLHRVFLRSRLLILEKRLLLNGRLTFLCVEVLPLFPFHGINAVSVFLCDSGAFSFCAQWVLATFFNGLLVQNGINDIFLTLISL